MNSKENSRVLRRAVRRGAAVALATALVSPAAHAQSIGFVAKELLGRPTDDSVTINVIADQAIEAYFERGTSSGNYSESTAPITYPDGYVELRLGGLSANTRYYYRMVYRDPNGGAWLTGEEHTFHTQRAPGTSFVFSVQSDSHQGFDPFYDATLYGIEMDNVAADDADLFFDLGDTFKGSDSSVTERRVASRIGQRHPAVTPPPLPEPSLHEELRPRLTLGCAFGQNLDERERKLLTHHFAQLTPENCMKPEPIHPTIDRFDFESADELVSFAEAHGSEVVGHTLCWHQQSPDWFFQSDANSKTPEQRLAHHIHTVAGRYEGRVAAWDVVNEAVADRGEYLRDTPWLRELGEGYVLSAFEHARHAAPSARLYYNDYNLELPDKRARTMRLLRNLLDAGARVDGVGIQGHWVLDQVPFEHIETAIEEYASLGLDVMFTELDLDVVPRPDCSADLDVQQAYAPSDDLYAEACPDDVLERQAEQLGRLFTLFTRHEAVKRVTFWGLQDGKSWLNTWPGRRTNHPLLFDRNLEPKPCFWRVLAAVRHELCEA